MPIYVYRNLNTGQTFEVEQRMVDEALSADPVTGDPVKRLIQPVGIAFKGSGFYVTDSRGKNGASASPAKSNGVVGDGDGARGDGARGDGAKPTSTGDAPKPTPGAAAATSGASTASAAAAD